MIASAAKTKTAKQAPVKRKHIFETGAKLRTKSGYCLGAQRLRGVASFLRQVLWSHWQVPSDHKASTNGEWGKILGIKVDQQIAEWVASRKKPEKVHKYTENCIVCLLRAGLTPVDTQLAVHMGNYGTAADILCTQWVGGKMKLSLVELKTGYDDYWAVTGGGPISLGKMRIPNTARNHAQLQVVATQLLMESSGPFDKESWTVPYVLHVYRKGAELFHVQEWTAKAKPLLKDLFDGKLLTDSMKLANGDITFDS